MITVSSVGEEYHLIEESRCECGGKWEPSIQSFIPEPPTDIITCSCNACGKNKKFEFDIKDMFGEPPDG